MVVTIGPEEHAKATKTLEIMQVRSFKFGGLIDARTFIERPLYSRLIRVRTKLKEALNRHETRLACTICAVPVYLSPRRRITSISDMPRKTAPVPRSPARQ